MLEIQAFRNSVRSKLIIWCVCVGILVNVLAGLISFNLQKGKIRGNAQQSQNYDLYDQFDESIDHYLKSKQNKDLLPVYQLAQAIYTKNKDKYAIDLYSFYKSNGKSNLTIFLDLRNRRQDLDTNLAKLDETTRLAKLDEIVSDFRKLNAFIEIERTEIIKAKHFAFAGNLIELKVLVEKAITKAEESQHIFTKCYYLLWLYKSDYSSRQVVANYKILINLAENIGLVKVASSASMSLAGIMEIKGEIQEAENLCSRLLQSQSKITPSIKRATNQILAIVKIRQGKNLEALQMIDNTIFEARESQDFYNVALALYLKSRILSDQNLFDQAKECINQANTEIKQSPKSLQTSQLETLLLAKLAEINLEQRNISQANIFYLQALELYEKTKPINYYILSWLYLGLANSASNAQTAANYRQQAASYLAIARSINDQPYSPIFKFSGE